MIAKPKPSAGGSRPGSVRMAYPIVDHTFDAIVVGAGAGRVPAVGTGALFTHHLVSALATGVCQLRALGLQISSP